MQLTAAFGIIIVPDLCFCKSAESRHRSVYLFGHFFKKLLPFAYFCQKGIHESPKFMVMQAIFVYLFSTFSGNRYLLLFFAEKVYTLIFAIAAPSRHIYQKAKKDRCKAIFLFSVFCVSTQVTVISVQAAVTSMKVTLIPMQVTEISMQVTTASSQGTGQYMTSRILQLLQAYPAPRSRLRDLRRPARGR